MGLLILWLAFACFFVAFHPGGIHVNGRLAQNPSDVFKYLMQRVTSMGNS